jgi:hypothetical protein
MPKNVSIEILSAAMRDRPRHFGDPSRRSQGKLAKTPDREARFNVTKPRVKTRTTHLSIHNSISARGRPLVQRTTIY